METLNPVIRRPKVLIVGAGLGGLTLGILLQRAGLDFEIYERAQKVIPLGSILACGPSTLALMDQLGLYQEFMKLAKSFSHSDQFNEKGESTFRMDFRSVKEMGGYPQVLIIRHLLYDLLLNQIQPERIHLGHKVTLIQQDEASVTLHLADGTTQQGDLLIGADGANSTVRQQMYQDLVKKKRLPRSDAKPLPFLSICLVGTTDRIEEEEFSTLGLEGEASFRVSIGDNVPCNWTTAVAPGNRVGWIVIQRLDKAYSKDDEAYKNFEWGPGAAESMCQQVRHFQLPKDSGKFTTLGDLIDRTPKEGISKAVLEEKVFETWYSGRVALLGDACHKMNPGAGLGAQSAMQDAIALANWINVMSSPSLVEVTRAFKEYRRERYPQVMFSYVTSIVFGRVFGKNTFVNNVLRAIVSHLPERVWRRVVAMTLACKRPLASFLPVKKDQGTWAKDAQPSFTKTLKMIEQAKKDD